MTSPRETQLNILSAISSGALCKFIEYPLDTVKVLLQADFSRFNSPIDCLKQIYRKNGLTGLYSGVTSPIVGAMLENSVLFTSYGFIKASLEVNPNPTLINPNPMWKYLLAGGISGVCGAFVVTPVELIKCRMQVENLNPGISSTPFSVTKQILREDGFRGLWKGNVSCLLREVPGSMAWFGVYEFIKTRIIQPALGYNELKDVPLGFTMIAGSFAGVAFWALPYPFDTVKSQIQTNTRFSRESTYSVFKTIIKEQGFGALYKGVGVTCGRAAFSNALLFYSYEVFYRYLEEIIPVQNDSPVGLG